MIRRLLIYCLLVLLVGFVLVVVHNAALPPEDAWFAGPGQFGATDPHHKNMLGQ